MGLFSSLGKLFGIKPAEAKPAPAPAAAAPPIPTPTPAPPPTPQPTPVPVPVPDTPPPTPQPLPTPKADSAPKAAPAPTPTPAPAKPASNAPFLGQKGQDLIKAAEGLAKKLKDGTIAAYPDPATGADPWTIGWGSTGKDIQKGTIWTVEQCQARFLQDAQKFVDGVAKAVGATKTTQNQFDALVSLSYNIGLGNLSKSTLLKKHNAGDHAGAAAEFAKWNKAAGKVMTGLTTRRTTEAKLYATPDPKIAPKS